ncbi:tail protein X [Sphingomonas pituitosa]|uniref:tail protein X n=1 Tax=Sphingomonas pituitosa TaxID=99597 RepID=UPI0008300D17|nr:tail protein X [Sphingomonas pituitosa]
MADILTTRQGDTLDELLWRERGLGPEALDAVLAANPGLAERGPTLPIGTPVTLPVLAAQAPPVRETVQLWS